MIFSIGCDHGGYEYKEELKKYLTSLGHEVIDCGTYSTDSCNYPEFAIKAAQAVSEGKSNRGIVICRSGVGVSICANKVKGIRCVLAYNPRAAELSREHNDANVLCFGARVVGRDIIKDMVEVFFATEFSGGRHAKRVEKLGAF